MIIRWVKNLQQAAHDREAAQKAIDGQKLTPAEQSRVEQQILKANREIERFAERINDDLRRAAEKRKPVRYPHGLDSIKDHTLKDYIASVRQTIGQLNHQIQVEGQRGDMYARQLEARRKDAVKVQETSKKNQTTLRREDEKLARRLSDAQKRLEDRKKDLVEIEREIASVQRHRTRYNAERERFDAQLERKRTELRNLEAEYKALESKKSHEPNRDRREPMKAELDRMAPKLQELRDFVNQQLKFQAAQMEKVREKLQHESSELTRARNQLEGDIKLLETELFEIKRARKDMKNNLEKEQGRMAAIGSTLDELRRTQDYAKKYGIVAQ
jgi:chromosome segregation ATPase